MIVLCGGTCSGKDTIKKELVKLGMEPVVTYTTRPMRSGEIDGVTYHFVNKSQFKRLEIQNFFAETAHYDVASGERWYYGSSYKDLQNNGLNKVMIINPSGIDSISRKISKEEFRDWFIVYLYCDEDIIRKRLKDRGDNEKEANRRIEEDKKDFKNIDKFVNMKICNNGSNNPFELANTILDTYDRYLVEG